MLDPFKILNQPTMASIYDEVGTKCSGFSSEGPFHCEDCIHKPAPDSPHCIHPMVLNDPDLQHRVVMVDGRPTIKVDLKTDCCRYVRPPADETKSHPHDDGTGKF